jgi:xylose isomerase
MAGKAEWRFSFGPWNINDGADVFGPSVRKKMDFAEKIKAYKNMGFDGVQFHDDDAVSSVDIPHDKMIAEANEMKKILDSEGLIAEFVAPRLWEHPMTIDGAYTANDPAARQYAIDRTKKAIDIANVLETPNIVLWPAREGIYVGESKNHVDSTNRFVDALNTMLDYDKKIRILGEMKPNEPMDHAYSPTTGHFMALGSFTSDPDRCGILIESAHALLAGIDPAMEMAFAISRNKLWSVHLNDQNGLKFDEDRIFGSINLKRAFDQVLVLWENDFGANGEFVGLDVKALRTQKDGFSTSHLSHSKQIFFDLLEVVESVDMKKVQEYRDSRNYEDLELYIVHKIMGK